MLTGTPMSTVLHQKLCKSSVLYCCPGSSGRPSSREQGNKAKYLDHDNIVEINIAADHTAIDLDTQRAVVR